MAGVGADDLHNVAELEESAKGIEVSEVDVDCRVNEGQEQRVEQQQAAEDAADPGNTADIVERIATFRESRHAAEHGQRDGIKISVGMA